MDCTTFFYCAQQPGIAFLILFCRSRNGTANIVYLAWWLHKASCARLKGKGAGKVQRVASEENCMSYQEFLHAVVMRTPPVNPPAAGAGKKNISGGSHIIRYSGGDHHGSGRFELSIAYDTACQDRWRRFPELIMMKDLPQLFHGMIGPYETYAAFEVGPLGEDGGTG